MADGLEQRIVLVEPRVVERGLQRLVGAPGDAAGVEARAPARRRCAAAKARLEQRIEPRAVGEAQALVGGEGDAELGLQRRDRGGQAQRLQRLAPLPGRDRQQHQGLAVAGREVAAEGAEEVVAHPRPLVAGQQGLGGEAQVGHGRGARRRRAARGSRGPRRRASAPAAPRPGAKAQ